MFEDFREKERIGWGSKAEFYKDHTALITTQAIPTLLRAVRARAGASLLDICTGPGYAAGAARAICASSTGIDFAPEMVEMAARSFPDCSFQVGDALQLDFADDTFDAAVCPFGIFHVTDARKAVSEGHRVIKAGGRYAFSQWCAPTESDFFRIVMGTIARHSDMKTADPAPDAFQYSDRDLCRDLMTDTGFSDIEVHEVPSVYHAPPGDFFENIMRLTVRGAIIVEAQTDDTKMTIREDMNKAVSACATDDRIVISVPSFVVSGVK
ncbi:MAG: methyltransferase domain-containing protein [Pseudomonadota bacterium]